MPMKPREMEKLILADGWIYKNHKKNRKFNQTSGGA